MSAVVLTLLALLSEPASPAEDPAAGQSPRPEAERLPAEPPAFDPRRLVDVELTAFASTPERFALCVGAHPGRPFEVDLCVGVDPSRGLGTLAAHGFYRKRWLFPLGGEPGRGFAVAVGPGLGVRAMRYCPYGPCAVALGPEVLASVEAVQWVSPGLGLTAQVDAGLAVLWAPATPGRLAPVLRVPAHLVVGLAF